MVMFASHSPRALTYVSIVAVVLLLPYSRSPAAWTPSKFVPIPPVIVEHPYTPRQWVGIPQGKRHPKMWTRSLQLNGPFYRDLNGIEIEEVPPLERTPPYAPSVTKEGCDSIEEAFNKWGQNGAAEHTSTADTHELGQLLARRALDRGIDMKSFFRDVNELSFGGQLVSYDSPRPTRIGQLHGATIMILGDMVQGKRYKRSCIHPHETCGEPDHDYKLDWDWILAVICSPDKTFVHLNFCMHGVGHALSCVA